MGKKCKCPPPGAPEWVLTYGDLMSLLLTFFILLVAMSEIKKEEKFQMVVTQVIESFGTFGGGAQIPSQTDPQLSMLERLENLMLRKSPERNESNTKEQGVDGRDPMVTKVREGMLFAEGGRVTFEPGSAQLSHTAKDQLRQVADLIRGYKNKDRITWSHRHHGATRRHGLRRSMGPKLFPSQGGHGISCQP